MRQLTNNRFKKLKQKIVEQEEPVEGTPDFNNHHNSAGISTHKSKHLFVVDWQVDSDDD